MLNNGTRPHKIPYKPSYWEYANGAHGGFIKDQDLWNNYYLLSLGGRSPSPKIESIYNNIIKYYARKKGVTPYEVTKKNGMHKGRALRERSLI